MKTTMFLILCLLLLPLQANAEEENTAKIITSFSNAAQCIAPVHILNIDGREVRLQRMGFDIDAGRHTMSGRTLVDTSFCQTVGRATYHDNTPPLEAEFEAGKTYWVGLDHNSPDRKDWKYVIWKVKD
jgi:hypothetical protein